MGRTSRNIRVACRHSDIPMCIIMHIYTAAVAIFRIFGLGISRIFAIPHGLSYKSTILFRLEPLPSLLLNHPVINHTHRIYCICT